MLNQEGIRQLKFDIRSNAKHYSQYTFGRVEECGTVQCMAGFCLRRAVGNQDYEKQVSAYSSNEPSSLFFSLKCVEAAVQQLGITRKNGSELPRIFSAPQAWSIDLAMKYQYAQTKQERAEVACEALDRLKEDGSIMSLAEYEDKLEKENAVPCLG